jgi:predicted dehydrogenase
MMSSSKQPSRRDFLRGSLAAGGVWSTGLRSSLSLAGPSKNDRPVIGCVGLGGRGRGISKDASRFGDVAAVCDVDRQRADAARQHLGGKSTVFSDYRKLLELKEIDAVVIATPDHWHTKIAIEAMLAGKDVYCEKPLTLTIDEGKQITRVVKQTGRVLQVGTQQRSEFGGRFLQAVAMIRDGRIGKLRRVTASTGGGQTGGPFQETDRPASLDWNMWLGQAPAVAYIPQRCHVNFRWWREYAGGQMTDWGAHHVDIALWAIGLPAPGQLQISGQGDVPEIKNGYNMPAQFDVTCVMPGGLPLRMVTGQRQGIMFEGETGRFFVNRGGIYGKPVEQLRENPLPEDAIRKLYHGKQPGSHMRNFFECAAARTQPISDAFSHHRAVTVLHLANLCLLLKRKLTWDLATEQILGDEHARSHQSRRQRKGFEINVPV